jgi:hypothetical protein
MRKQTEKRWKGAFLLAVFLLIACNANLTKNSSQTPTTPPTSPTLASPLDTTAPSDAQLEAQVTVTDAGTLPADCSVLKVAATLLRFVDAFNHGDQRQLDEVFQIHNWYTVDERSGESHHEVRLAHQSELLTYFAERHQKGERMRLLEVDTSSTLGWHGGVDFAYVLTRQAEDLPDGPNHIAQGKGAMTCPERKIFISSMGSEAILAAPGGIHNRSCPEPPPGSPPNAVIACTREQP